MVEIHYGTVINDDMQQRVTGTLTNTMDISETNLQSLLSNNADPRYISFDGAGIDLNDNYKIFLKPLDYAGGVFNAISNQNCEIADQQENITIHSNFTYSGPITLKFYGDCCREMVVRYSFEDTTNEFETVPIDSELFVWQPSYQGQFYSLTIFFTKTAIPNQYVKLSYMKYGEMVVLNKFKEIELLEEINVLSDDLPINSLGFTTIVNNPLEFSDGNIINVYSNGKYYGTFYLDDVQKKAKNTYQIQAQNSIDILENTEFLNWQSTVVNCESFLNIISESSEVKFISEENLSNISVFGHIPVVTNRRALCEYMFATGLLVDSSRNDKIILKKIPQTISSAITTESKRIIGEATYTKNKHVTGAVFSYPQTYTTEEVEIQLKNNADENILHIFENAPIEIYSHLGNVAGVETSYNHICLTAEDGDTILYGYKINFNKKTENIINDRLIGASVKQNVMKFDSFNVRPQESNMEQKKSDIAKYIKSGGTVTAKIRLRNEKVGDLIQIETAYDGIITGIITSMNIHFGYEDTADIEVLEWQVG